MGTSVCLLYTSLAKHAVKSISGGTRRCAASAQPPLLIRVLQCPSMNGRGPVVAQSVNRMDAEVVVQHTRCLTGPSTLSDLFICDRTPAAISTPIVRPCAHIRACTIFMRRRSVSISCTKDHTESTHLLRHRLVLVPRNQPKADTHAEGPTTKDESILVTRCKVFDLLLEVERLPVFLLPSLNSVDFSLALVGPVDAISRIAGMDREGTHQCSRSNRWPACSAEMTKLGTTMRMTPNALRLGGSWR